MAMSLGCKVYLIHILLLEKIIFLAFRSVIVAKSRYHFFAWIFNPLWCIFYVLLILSPQSGVLKVDDLVYCVLSAMQGRPRTPTRANQSTTSGFSWFPDLALLLHFAKRQGRRDVIVRSGTGFNLVGKQPHSKIDPSRSSDVQKGPLGWMISMVNLS